MTARWRTDRQERRRDYREDQWGISVTQRPIELIGSPACLRSQISARWATE